MKPQAKGPPGDAGIKYVRGDAADPQRDGPAVIAHVVNDRARRWGGRGSRSLMDRHPDAAGAYAAWNDGRRPLGAVHLHQAAPDVWVASLVAQAGYGTSPTGQPGCDSTRSRQGLETLA